MRGPPGSGFIGQNTLSRAAPARTTPAQSLPHRRAEEVYRKIIDADSSDL